MAHDPFLGTWELDPTRNQYEIGTPPQQGTYIIATAPNGGYHVTMAWISADGQQMQASYASIPDGNDYPFAESSAIDSLCTTRVDDHTLDTVTKKDGEIVAVGHRELSPDGQQMTITQSGMAPDGTPFANVSVYNRRA